MYADAHVTEDGGGALENGGPFEADEPVEPGGGSIATGDAHLSAHACPVRSRICKGSHCRMFMLGDARLFWR